MKKNWVLSVARSYVIFAVFFIILFPLMFYISSIVYPHSLGAKVKVLIISYSIIVGLLYAISAIYTFRLKKIGFIMGIITSLFGALLIFPLAGLLVTLTGYFLAKEDIHGRSNENN